MYLRAETWSTGHDARPCSNCDRPATPEPASRIQATDLVLDSEPIIFSCSTCGQREAVSWRSMPPLVVEEVKLVEEPHIILGEH